MGVELNLKAPATDLEIRTEVSQFRDRIAVLQSEIALLQQGIRHYQRQCMHVGQVTGRNERDGSWGNPCPTCGYSY